MKGEQAMEVFKLVKSKGMLPTKLDELIPLSFIGQAAVEFCTSKIKLMNKLNVAEEQRKATLRDGQDAGELLLEIEGRIGNLAEKEERAKPKIDIRSAERDGNLLRGGVKPSGKPPKHERLGLEKKRMHQAQQIAQHPEVVEEIKKKARRNEDIPTKTAVLSEIKYQREVKARKRKEKELKIPKERPDINEFVDRIVVKIDDLLPDLIKIVGNTQYIDLGIKMTLKAKLNGLNEVLGKLKKEIN